MVSEAADLSRKSSPQVVSSVIDWFFLPPGYTGVLARLTGLSALLCGPLLYVLGLGGKGPYLVPTWRLGNVLIDLPQMSPQAAGGLCAAFVIACLWLILGRFHKLPVAVAAVIFAYFGSSDLMAAHCSFVVVTFTYLLALLFARPNEASCTRRLVQISVIVVYFYSVFWKLLFPGFLTGESFEAQFADGWALKSIWHPLLSQMKPDLAFWQISAWATILLEAFIAVGLAVKKWRKWAAIAGIALHAGIAVFLDDQHILSIFSLIMVTGYLAFFERKGEVRQADAEDAAVEPAWSGKYLEGGLAIAFALFLTLFPLRILFWKDRPVTSMWLLDRSPWNFSMFVMRVGYGPVSVRIKDQNGRWLNLYDSAPGRAPTGTEALSWKRASEATTDNELLKMARLVTHEHPEAREIEITSEYYINKRNRQKKILHGQADGQISIQIQN